MGSPNYITPSGYRRLVDELTWLASEERPRVVREVADAAAEGDRSENAAYIYGKRRLREIDRRMRFLQKRLEVRQDRVFFGATVAVEDENGTSARYRIVGVDETDPKRGWVSWQSPIGKALLGKKVDEAVSVRWHAGSRELTILEIEYEGDPSG
jgi:transcription elongation factor GreB